MKVCWFGIYHREYSRNEVLISGLQMNGVEMIECNVKPNIRLKYFRLIRELWSVRGQYDVLYCAFPINYNVLIAALFQRKPIVIDAFFPLHDAYVHDRKTTSRFSVKSIVYATLDRINLWLADLVIADTTQHKYYWQKLYAKAKIEVVPVGASTEEFFPFPQKEKSDNQFLVTFHGSYIPLQGIDKIVEAAECLKDDSRIKFRFIGTGQLFPQIKQMIVEKKLDIELLPWLPVKELNEKLNEADVILGIFGDSAKTNRVVPNKVFQGMAVQKPVISKDTPAMRELFNDEIILISGDSKIIANAIRGLSVDQERCLLLAQKAFDLFEKFYTEIALGSLLRKVLEKENMLR